MMKNRYEFMFFVEAANCNPNGDPDMGNYPRADLETMEGIITDVAIKRRIRNYIEEAYQHKFGMDIMRRDSTNINTLIAELVLETYGGKIERPKGKDSKFNNKKAEEASVLACNRYFDVRTFGGVLSVGLNAGQIRGPVQLGISKSLDPIFPIDATLSVCSYTEAPKDAYTLEEYHKYDEEKDRDTKRTFGRKIFIPYGLYVVKGSISANLANKTGFSDNDMNVLFEAIMNMYNNDISASKKGMSVIQPLIIFKHIGNDNTTDEKQKERETLLGCAPAYKLYESVKAVKKDGVEYPRNYTDYDVTIDKTNLPNGIQIGFKYGPFDEIIWDKLGENDTWLKMI